MGATMRPYPPFSRALIACFATLFLAGGPLRCDEIHNNLSSSERADGWKLLFDGVSMANWIDPSKESPPGDAWTISEGCLKANPDPRITEDLISSTNYTDFELQFDWKIAPGGNSGVKYRIQKLVLLSHTTVPSSIKKFRDQVQYAMVNSPSGTRSQIKDGEEAQIYVVGFEYQMIDNKQHPEAKNGGPYHTGALYSIIGPSHSVQKPVGEFNHSMLVVKGKHVEHWLNGVKVVDTSLDTPTLKRNLDRRWGQSSQVYHLLVDQLQTSCPISLQNHGAAVWFRDIKIKPF
jgi:hypothetical protein